MNVYRAPAVALMPDITPEENRSKANSFINILGGCGTALGVVLAMFLSKNNQKLMFFITSGLMVACLIYIIFFLKEKKFVEEYQETNQEQIEEKINEEEITENRKESKANIIKMLFGILFFFMSFNAIETFMSLYTEEVFTNMPIILGGIDFGSLAIGGFGAGCFIFAIPAASLAEKFGRKMTVIGGAAVVALAYGGITIVSFLVGFSYIILVLFLIGGLGYACVIINILPMVLEHSNVTNTGKYTGYYYTASMVAQSITPALAGLFLSKLIFGKMIYLFPYAIVFIIFSIIAFALVNNKNKNLINDYK